MSAPIPCPFGPIEIKVRTVGSIHAPLVAALCTPALDAYFAERERADLAELSREMDEHILEGKPLGPAWTGEGRVFESDDDPPGVAERLVGAMRSENEALEAEIARLERENAALRSERDALVKGQRDWREKR